MRVRYSDASTRLAAIVGALRKTISDSKATLKNASTAAGKIYELECLHEICRRLKASGTYSLAMAGGSKLRFRTKGGPIDRTYSRIEIRTGGAAVAELWTDLYFNTLSSSHSTDNSHFHELDIAIVKPDIPEGRNPEHSDVMAACECKDPKFNKGMIRAILGLRRELSYLDYKERAVFLAELGPVVKSTPPSHVFLFCSDPTVANYTQSPAFFDICVEHFR